VISEGSCDTEDWSNDPENTALITGINYTLLFTYSNRNFTLLLFLLYFWSNKHTHTKKKLLII